MSAQTTWTSFGPDPPPSTLPAPAQACLIPVSSSPACDAFIGSAAQGSGFCALDEYKQTTYCACVNNAVACPQYAMASCANAAFAYRPAAWYAKTGAGHDSPSENDSCKSAPICVNLVEIGGEQNLVSGITQQCGTITNITNILKTNPTLAILAAVLLIMLIVVMSIHTDADSKLPPMVPFNGELPAPSNTPFNGELPAPSNTPFNGELPAPSNMPFNGELPAASSTPLPF